MSKRLLARFIANARLHSRGTRARVLLSLLSWLYKFAVDNPPSDRRDCGRNCQPQPLWPDVRTRSVVFLRALLAERQDFGERLIEQRLVIYQRWVKSFSPLKMHDSILEANKKLLLETMLRSVNLSLEAEESECVGDGSAAECEDDKKQ